MVKNPVLKRIVDQKRKRTVEQAQQSQNSPSDVSNNVTERQQSSIAATLTSFVLDADSYEFRDTWILDSNVNSYVCNDRRRFKFECMTMKEEQLVTGKSVHLIETFDSVTVIIKSSNDPTQIQFLDVTLVSGFFTNTVSLHRFTTKGVH